MRTLINNDNLSYGITFKYNLKNILMGYGFMQNKNRNYLLSSTYILRTDFNSHVYSPLNNACVIGLAK